MFEVKKTYKDICTKIDELKVVHKNHPIEELKKRLKVLEVEINFNPFNNITIVFSLVIFFIGMLKVDPNENLVGFGIQIIVGIVVILMLLKTILDFNNQKKQQGYEKIALEELISEKESKKNR